MGTNPNQQIMQAVMTTRSKMDPGLLPVKFSLFDPSGNSMDLTIKTGANLFLTGYAPHAVGSVLATDSVNVAIAKLEARIAVLEA